VLVAISSRRHRTDSRLTHPELEDTFASDVTYVLDAILSRESETSTKMSQQDQIELYLRTGKDDSLDPIWPGDTFIGRAGNRNNVLRRALISEVVKRTPNAAMPIELVGMDLEEFARTKIEPMVRGLFPASEQEAVTRTLSRSVIFLTSDNIAPTILSTPFLATAWQLANLYLISCGVTPLSANAPEIVGLSEATTCYVSTVYFGENRLTDFVIHEAAHVFHNSKRKTIGLPEIRGREWLLEIDYHKREMFAYVCEAYGCIVAQGRSERIGGGCSRKSRAAGCLRTIELIAPNTS
jgi:hypothetical protein